MKGKKAGAGLDDVRRLALALDDVEEGTSYGTPAFKRRGKLMLRMHQDGESLVARTDFDARDALVAAKPSVFYFTDHYREHPWVLVRLGAVSPAGLREVIEQAWARVAPPKKPPKKASAPKAAKKSRAPAHPLDRLRAICAALPDTEETIGHGRPVFKVRGKTFAMFLDNHHDDGRVAIWCKAPPGMQSVAVKADPARFFVPPYVGKQGWIGVRLDIRPDWEAVAECVAESHRLAQPAPRRSRKP
jgi:hypothetical protein